MSVCLCVVCACMRVCACVCGACACVCGAGGIKLAKQTLWFLSRVVTGFTLTTAPSSFLLSA